MNVSLRAPSDKKKEGEGGCWALSSEPGRQALAPGMFINLKIFQMLLQCCFFWFSGQGECIEGTGFRLIELLLDRGCPGLRGRGKHHGARGSVVSQT